MFKNKNILITGGTGSLGQALVKKILKSNPKSIRIYSRDESKQETMAASFNDDKLRFLIGDIRDKERLTFAMKDINIVIHTAALKRVPAAEYNPFEFVKTNIAGSQNVIDAAMSEEVDVCLGISTDKAVSPLNLYGSTKLSMEKLFVAANYYKGKRHTFFSCVRYGNVLGSSGSVVPKFLSQIKETGIITVTNENMTRFNITMNEALDLIISALSLAKGSEIFIPKLHAYRLKDLIQAISEITKKSFKIKKIPIRTGEKTHELLLNEYEIPYTVETNGLYVLLPPDYDKYLPQHQQNQLKKAFPNSKPLKLTDYSSNQVKLLTVNELKKILKGNCFSLNS